MPSTTPSLRTPLNSNSRFRECLVRTLSSCLILSGCRPENTRKPAEVTAVYPLEKKQEAALIENLGLMGFENVGPIITSSEAVGPSAFRFEYNGKVYKLAIQHIRGGRFEALILPTSPGGGRVYCESCRLSQLHKRLQEVIDANGIREVVSQL